MYLYPGNSTTLLEMYVCLQYVEVKELVLDDLRVGIDIGLNQFCVWSCDEGVTMGRCMAKGRLQPVHQLKELYKEGNGDITKCTCMYTYTATYIYTYGAKFPRDIFPPQIGHAETFPEINFAD